MAPRCDSDVLKDMHKSNEFLDTEYKAQTTWPVRQP